MQKIPLAWLKKGELHPSVYHRAMLKVLRGAQGMNFQEINRKYFYVIIQPDGRDAMSTVLQDLETDGIVAVREAERTIRKWHGKVQEWYIVKLLPDTHFTNSLYADYGVGPAARPLLVKEPDNVIRVRVRENNLAKFIEEQRIVDKAALQRKFRSKTADELARELSALRDDGKITIEQIKTSGRPKTIIRAIL